MGNTLLKMLGERTGVSRELAPITSEVVKVTAENFEEKAMDKSKHVLAYLYSPWNEQKPVQEALEKAAKIFAAETDVLVIKLPIERVFERDIADRFKVKDYPGVVYFDKKNEHELWGGPYDDAAHWVRFLNKKLGTAYEASGKLKVEAGRVKKLDTVLNDARGALDAPALDALKAAAAELPDDQKEMADYYLRTAEKVQEKGAAYVEDEIARLDKLLKNVSPTKKKQFMIRKNILGAFKAAAAKMAHGGEL